MFPKFFNFLVKIPELIFERILTELRSEKFEWFGPSPIEPFNSGSNSVTGVGTGTVLGGVRTWAQIFASVKTDSKEKVNKQSIKVQKAAKISKIHGGV